MTLFGGMAAEQGLPALTVSIIGRAQTQFDPARDGCDGNDVPDAPARAFKDSAGGMVMFGLHYVNRAFRGADLDHMKLDCKVVLGSAANPDPAAFDDYSWITAVWTRDGSHVEALVHEEFHANEHKGACLFSAYMQCWYNTILGVHSNDAAHTFVRSAAPVAAAAPFRADYDQGRHRGFFNPSNILDIKGRMYFLASTTGWTGQPGGVCLFASRHPENPGAWRAFDGSHFNTAFADPYTNATKLATHCQVIAPFPAPVGALVRQRGSGVFVAVFMAQKDAEHFPVSGFYYATASDLTHWSQPRLLLAGQTLYDNPCHAGRLIAYPSVLDPRAGSRVFADVGTSAWLYFASLKVDGCNITADRTLMRVQIRIAAMQ